MNRAILYAPLLYALTGAGIGISVRMLFHSDPPFRVPLDSGMPLLVVGALVGGVVGCRVAEGGLRNPGRVPTIGLITVTVLCVAIAAPLGWVAGSLVAYDRLPRADVATDVKHLPLMGMAAGAVTGCVGGLAVGGVQLRLDRRRSER